MRIVPPEIKEQVLLYVREFPGVSKTQIAKIFGVERHSVSDWVNGGRSEKRKISSRAFQKQRIQKVKNILIQFLGGCCVKCGYHGCDSALDFHHKNPAQKENEVSRLLMGDFNKAVEEAKKCELLCCRCHRELHETE